MAVARTLATVLLVAPCCFALEAPRLAQRATGIKRAASPATVSSATASHGLQPQLYASKTSSATRAGEPQMGLSRTLILTKIAPSVGAVAANCMFLSCFQAVMQVRDKGDMGDLNAIPLVAIAGNTAAWLGYAFTTKDPFVFAANFPGLLLGLLYSSTAIKNAPAGARLLVERLLIGYAGILGVSGFVAASGVLGTAQQVMGYVANALLVIYYSAPLSTIGQVIAQRSAASLFAPLLMMNTVNGLMWTIYGLATSDPFVWSINGLGAVLSVMQLLLKIVF